MHSDKVTRGEKRQAKYSEMQNERERERESEREIQQVNCVLLVQVARYQLIPGNNLTAHSKTFAQQDNDDRSREKSRAE